MSTRELIQDPDMLSWWHQISPQNLPRQSAIAKGFAEANSVFIVITSAKIFPR